MFNTSFRQLVCAGVQTQNLLRAQNYSDPVGAYVHAWRPGHWFTWMFEVGSVTRTGGNQTFKFSAGGHQGGKLCDRTWIVLHISLT